jgi:hypothetical protein
MKAADPRISETDPGLRDSSGRLDCDAIPVAIGTSFPVCGMPAAVAASSLANMLAA